MPAVPASRVPVRSGPAESDLRSFVAPHVDRAAAIIGSIEKNLRVLGWSHADLCARVGMSISFWRYCRTGRRAPSPALLARITAALAGAAPVSPPAEAGAADPRRVAVMGLIALASSAFQAVPDLAVGLDPRRARRGQRATRGERAAAAARVLGAYLAVTVAGMRQADVARVLDVDRAVVCRACRQIEDRRDDPAFDALARRLEGIVRGRA